MSHTQEQGEDTPIQSENKLKEASLKYKITPQLPTETKPQSHRGQDCQDPLLQYHKSSTGAPPSAQHVTLPCIPSTEKHILPQATKQQDISLFFSLEPCLQGHKSSTMPLISTKSESLPREPLISTQTISMHTNNHLQLLLGMAAGLQHPAISTKVMQEEDPPRENGAGLQRQLSSTQVMLENAPPQPEQPEGSRSARPTKQHTSDLQV